MKKGIWILFLLVISTGMHAAHIAGGELQYRYLGPGATAGTDLYQITMRLFRECSSNGPQLATEIVNVGVYSTASLSLYTYVVLPLSSGIDVIRMTPNSIPCLVGSPDVCYQVAIYSATISLPSSSSGYILSWARCCRANGIYNIGNAGQIGATYISKIPGSAALNNGHNSSPQFVVKDTALVCSNNDFVLDFGANDIDGDSLSYGFCDAYLGGSTMNSSAPPPNNLFLQAVPYSPGFNGTQPMGPNVKIDAATGIISGVAPAVTGRYVVSVCVTEWRNGTAISEHRKDFILKVGDCDILAAKLKPEYVLCDNYTTQFLNESNSSQVQTYFWDFGVPASPANNTTSPSPSFTYPDTGVYRVMLIVNRGQECTDTATALVKVFPGFNPGFNVSGSCYKNPFIFTDATTANYGTVNSWRWDFGDAGNADTSNLKNPSYKYSSAGEKKVTLTVGSSKGCTDTVSKIIEPLEKPLIHLPFHDTLICSIDTLPLVATGTGSFSWSPATNIINQNTGNPYVYPKVTTVYYVDLIENGCRNRDSVKVNVLDSITVQLMADTAICKTDSIKIITNSPALSYSWSPATGLNNSLQKEPLAAPSVRTSYTVLARLGNCVAKDSVTIRVSPYPVANAGADTSICFGDKVQLSGSVTCVSYSWSPMTSMAFPTSLQPLVAPGKTTTYVLKAVGFEECPKAVYDSIIVNVYSAVRAFAGNDTMIASGEPLLLNATGGIKYQWSPAIYMNNSQVANPVVTLAGDIDSMYYKVRVTTAEGCEGEDDIRIIKFNTGPDIFIPNAFTPDKDGRNDIFRPILVGMKQLDFFRIYNRYGQVIYSTTEHGRGWNGTINGKDQPAGTYIFMTQAENYKGDKVFKKGTVLLIR